jgi:metalloendopeptidase OMA1, mitochondrial
MDYSVYVVQSSLMNAVVLPGGQIFVFTGILPVAKNEDGLATVLGHEV